ncbi:MAG: transglutaminase domain-containing protein [Candidatus Saccharicenans sp.]
MLNNKILSLKIGLFLFMTLSFLALLSCRQPEHFLKDPDYGHLVHKQYLKRANLAYSRSQELFSVLKKKLTLEEKEALEFLYAFMPLSDLANLEGEYFLAQVRTALKARNFFPWGKKIPEEIFRHFVLPYRVNNENLDQARQVFFEQLKDRIKNLDMGRAALEVNHWCHEKVTYRSTDERTSSPLSTVKTAFGRCGEESTFTVAALRAVSIPARQVYTPRWVHTDDNHAWVEVWVDGRWYYLGACEPEPELNMGWFSGPVKRAMLVQTTVFGQYHGPEEILLKTDLYTRINQLPNYAPTASLRVEVKDGQGQPVQGANVDFCIYNYAEFYPVVTKITDDQGQASILTGLGDLFVQAYKDNLWAWAKVTAGKTETLTLILTEPDFSEREIDLDIIPPIPRNVPPPDPARAEENNRRWHQEEAIRESYVATFINRDIAQILAREKGWPEDLSWHFLEASQGNWMEIVDYLSALKPEEFKFGFGLLTTITEKDLRDTPAQILLHHLHEAPARPEKMDESLYLNYVLSPRIGRELLSSWRTYLKQRFNETEKSDFVNNPEKIAEWLKTNLTLDDSNYYNVPLLPHKAIQLGRADLYSEKILFVAIARTLGIPARIDRATGRASYFKDGDWQDVFFEAEESGLENGKKARLRIYYEPVAGWPKPSYYTHFTLARFSGGCYHTLDYENEPAIKSFPAELRVDPGNYLMVSGYRQPDGSVLCRLNFFKLLPNETKEVKLSFRTGFIEPMTLGQFSPEAAVYDLKKQTNLNLKSLVKNKSLIVLMIEPDKEPTKHLMEEVQALSDQLSNWPGLFVVAIVRDRIPANFGPDTYQNLPASSKLVYDAEGQLFRSIVQSLKNEPSGFPVVIACRSDQKIIFYSEGYRLGTAEQLIKTLVWLK